MAWGIRVLLDLVVGSNENRDRDPYQVYPPVYRWLMAVSASVILVIAMVLVMEPLGNLTSLRNVAVVVWVLATEPFVWNVLVRDRSHPMAYAGLIVMNLAALITFVVMHQHNDPVSVFYFLVVLAALDFAFDTPMLNRVIPLAMLLSLGGVMPPFPISVGLTLAFILVLREIRAYFYRRYSLRTLDALRKEITQAKDAGYRDELTGLFTRAIMPDQVEGLFSYCRETNQPFGLVMFDIDRLKSANDTNGHQFGDRVIAHAASLILAAKRTEDFAVRYGGDELMLVTTGVDDYASLLAIADRIRERVRENPIEDFTVTLSIGCMLFPVTDAADFADVLRKADRALYAAKQRGRDRVVCADDPEVFTA
jgi:diguanylate cyclase (GGDEF)-like protein